MLATPGQTPEKARRLAEYGLSLGIPHLSSYLLKIEPGTPFDSAGMAARCPDDDTAADCYLAYYQALEQAGFSHHQDSKRTLLREVRSHLFFQFHMRQLPQKLSLDLGLLRFCPRQLSLAHR